MLHVTYMRAHVRNILVANFILSIETRIRVGVFSLVPRPSRSHANIRHEIFYMHQNARRSGRFYAVSPGQSWSWFRLPRYRVLPGPIGKLYTMASISCIDYRRCLDLYCNHSTNIYTHIYNSGKSYYDTIMMSMLSYIFRTTTTAMCCGTFYSSNPDSLR